MSAKVFVRLILDSRGTFLKQTWNEPNTYIRISNRDRTLQNRTLNSTKPQYDRTSHIICQTSIKSNFEQPEPFGIFPSKLHVKKIYVTTTTTEPNPNMFEFVPCLILGKLFIHAQVFFCMSGWHGPSFAISLLHNVL